MWVFGYGSLTWKVDFPTIDSVVGYIKGYERRFWQGSADHRGVPDKPGRVATLVESSSPESCVWGVAYQIADDQVSNVFEHLDFRERNGYKSMTLPFYPKQTNNGTNIKFTVHVYIATTENIMFLGPASVPDIAKCIHKSRGMSGENKEYLFQLASAMRDIAPHVNDSHLFDLESEVRRLCEDEN